MLSLLALDQMSEHHTAKRVVRCSLSVKNSLNNNEIDLGEIIIIDVNELYAHDVWS